MPITKVVLTDGRERADEPNVPLCACPMCIEHRGVRGGCPCEHCTRHRESLTKSANRKDA